ncbi:hypothetical protein K438DRAFT_1754043 [Mycena galopus ATCC 62051]|nr:hypothetical protein K438DRAFT_1754043 [Mycena galopus ATCC 62051]
MPHCRLITADLLHPIPLFASPPLRCYRHHRQLKYKVDCGRSHYPNTKDKDEEENRDFNTEIEEQGWEDEELMQPRPKKSAPKKTKPPTELEAESRCEDEGNEVPPDSGSKKGPIPEKIKKVHALYAQLIEDVKALATECRKPTTSLYSELDLIGKVPVSGIFGRDISVNKQSQKRRRSEHSRPPSLSIEP